jgi:hypothetical protein
VGALIGYGDAMRASLAIVVSSVIALSCACGGSPPPQSNHNRKITELLHPGKGWFCFHDSTDTTVKDFSACSRTEGECEEALASMVKSSPTVTFTACAARPEASCFAFKDRKQNVVAVLCAESAASCAQGRVALAQDPDTEVGAPCAVVP